MYSVKSYYEITLMHLLTILSYLLIPLKYNVQYCFLFLAIVANDHQISQKKDHRFETTIFCRNEKVQIAQKLEFVLQR